MVMSLQRDLLHFKVLTFFDIFMDCFPLGAGDTVAMVSTNYSKYASLISSLHPVKQDLLTHENLLLTPTLPHMEFLHAFGITEPSFIAVATCKSSAGLGCPCL